MHDKCHKHTTYMYTCKYPQLVGIRRTVVKIYFFLLTLQKYCGEFGVRYFFSCTGIIYNLISGSKSGGDGVKILELSFHPCSAIDVFSLFDSASKVKVWCVRWLNNKWWSGLQSLQHESIVVSWPFPSHPTAKFFPNCSQSFSVPVITFHLTDDSPIRINSAPQSNLGITRSSSCIIHAPHRKLQLRTPTKEWRKKEFHLGKVG